MWKSSRICGIKLEVFQNLGFGIASSEWTAFDVDVSKFSRASTLISHWSLFIQGTDDPVHDWRGLMIPHCLRKWDNRELLVDGVPMKFLYAPNDIKVGTHTFHTFESYENSWGTMVT